LLIESEGQIYKADTYYFPKERWSAIDQEWLPYKGEVPKPEAWGDIVTEAEAAEFQAP